MRHVPRLLILLIVGWSLLACARLDRGVYGERFEPLGVVNGEAQFRFVTMANWTYPLTSARAEAKRIAWLEETLEVNGYGGRPYRILAREPMAKRVIGGTAYDVHYTVAVRAQAP